MGFTRLLVVGRSELPRRVVAAAEALGARAEVADVVSVTEVLAAAERSGADAIHPGFGDLAQSVDLAEACVANGWTFLGPPLVALRATASRAEVRRRMWEAGVPLPAGGKLPAAPRAAVATASEIGFPLVVKTDQRLAPGEPGSRRAERAADLPAALAEVRAMATAAGAPGDLIVERWLTDACRIGVVVAGGESVDICALGAEGRSVSTELRHSLDTNAIAAAAALEWAGPGRVDFLLHGERAFVFLKMSILREDDLREAERHQGLDLITRQLYRAAGRPQLGDPP